MLSTPNPLITCLCITRERPEFLRRAIDCFEGQSYENKQLLIVADRDEDLGGLGAGHSVIVIGQRLRISQKRNFGCNLAQGEIIAHWDDDDFSYPQRLRVQFECLQITGKNVCGIRNMRFTDGMNWWQYQTTENWVLGTSLMYTKEYWCAHPFRNELVTSEDFYFSREAHKRRQLVVSETKDLMYATIHPTNTSPKVVTDQGWQQLSGS